MEFIEVKLATLDKETITLGKQLDKERQQIDLMTAALQANIKLYWDHIRQKYPSQQGKHYFIRGNTLYERKLQ